ncbi:hypothetical protein FC83_GL000338 [Agrilactobacillus composti DSM 18527 = JCM 14202]|uniref:DUF2264 domain-containing protein n=1 Tax=Agrilactobacillus composti DSM 18527 = JCM 14202 TaxID=1423734 RepID=A0A0R1XXC0_9LACO|nr:DUF2264 domain-containing protein [Agrilactobacillus composti]KRM32473.1 hypothetical protein FC83_GL000338 [Agrilactobacillus composti DSM 18527 = JCM 14202]
MQAKLFNAQIKDNPLRSKADVLASLLDFLRPAMKVLAQQERAGRFNISASGAVYIQDKTEIEGFMRLLWGLGPFFADHQRILAYPEWYELTIHGILAGTDPESKDYWGGELGDYDQMFVEMGALTAFLYETKADFWDHLSGVQQQQILAWLEQVNHRVIPKTNWLFFRAMVNSFFVTVDVDTKGHQALIDADFAITNGHYLDHGWSYDGYENQIDNYIPFAYQFFTLVFVGLTNWDNDQTRLLKERATAFIKSYANWFAADGAALPYGRSLDYRFAQAAFWGVCAFAHIDLGDYTLGDIKHLLLNNLRWWFKQDIFTTDGLMPIGYAYPNMNFAEGYNGPASAYWALKSYIFLVLPDDDPFWQAQESDTFKFEALKLQPEPRMLVAHSQTGLEVQAFTAGQHSHEHAHGAAKYEKYVYSTTFGFSTPKGTTLLKQGAFDSTLAVSESDNFWRTVFKYEDYQLHEDYIYANWQPWPDVTIKNFVIPAMPWHVRIHQIHTDRTLHLAEGSFAAPHEGIASEAVLPTTVENAVFYQTHVGITGLVGLSPELKVSLTEPEPNTSLYFPKTKLPLQTGVLKPGDYTLMSLYLGDRELESLQDGQVVVPAVQLNQNTLVLTQQGSQRSIQLAEF